uniref:CUE domain-containing protein n=1 Tax=Caenorhabditis tropicalis TaxID=1561998 RepID=A0A1I7TZT4_9PELO
MYPTDGGSFSPSSKILSDFVVKIHFSINEEAVLNIQLLSFYSVSSLLEALMSSRPITNLERILASVNFKEDEVVITPEPLMANGSRPIFNFDQIPAPDTEDTDFGVEAKKEKDDEEFFTASQGSSSDEDVPLTAELLSPGVQVQTSSGSRYIHHSRQSLIINFRNVWNGSRRATADDQDVNQERNKKRKMKQRRSNGKDEKRESEKGKKN